jgi:tetratricopeptide (TPR) repeat protein
MVSERVITVKEARDLCEQMLVAIQAMSASAIKEQYETIYRNISDILHGRTFNKPAVNSSDDNSENIIDKSHRLATEILSRIVETPAGERTERWLENLLYSCCWWEESDRFFFKDSLLIQGHGQYGIYFFPAVRLALIAAGLQAQITDPAVRIMRERRETHKLLKDHEYLLDRNDLSRYDEEVSYAFRDFDTAAQVAPRDERIENLRGAFLLRLNRLAEADEALGKSLAMLTSAGSFRAGTLYDLACVYARQNRFDKCRQALLESAELRPLDKKWMAKDVDLQSVRHEQWFQELLLEEAE